MQDIIVQEMRFRDHAKEFIRKYEFRYGNLSVLLFFSFLAYALITPPYIDLLQDWIRELGTWGYLGILIAGSFFTYALTTPVAIVTLFVFGEFYHPLVIASIGAAGAVISDMIIYTFFRKRLSSKASKIGKALSRRIHSRLAKRIGRSLIPLLAIFILASPLPDELAAAIMGSMRFNTKKFLIISYIANFIGIFLIATFGSSIL